MKNYELRNLLRFCLNPFTCGRTLFFYIRRVLFSFQYRYAPIVLQYPKKVREPFDRIPPLPEGFSPPARGGVRGGGSGGVGAVEAGEPDWRKEFDDPEKTMYVHRWGWLIYDQMGQEQGVALIRSWLAAMGTTPKGIAGTSYTTSERIVNALLFLTHNSPSPQPSPPLTLPSPLGRGVGGEGKGGEGAFSASPLLAGEGQGEGVPDDLRAALLKMSYHLARNIEYHGARGTGNHIVNNARALFFAGQILDIKELSDLAFAILKDALPWLVTPDGFLREESSHYHLLFTRWVIEIYELAKKTGHKEIDNYLELWVKKLAERCWFFIVETPTPPNPPSGRGGESRNFQIPLIGDVSPDCLPEWLIEYLMPYLGQYTPSPPPSPPKGGEGVSSAFPLPAGEGRVRGLQAFPQSGWFRLDYGDATIFWHTPQTNMIHRATHGHGDMCSFVLFHKGKPILIDPGRLTYQSNEGCLVRDHNTLTIDGLDPFIYDRAQKFPAFYQRRKVKCEWKQEGEQFIPHLSPNTLRKGAGFIFSISHTGFRRLAGDVIDHTRRFYLSDGSLEIEDELRGKRVHTIETFFHFAPGADKIEFQHSLGERKMMKGWTFPCYGVKIPSELIMVKVKTQFPVKLHYRFQWEE